MFWKNIMTIASVPTDSSYLWSQYMHLLPSTHTWTQDILSRIHWRDHIWACQITCKFTERNEKRVPGAFVRDAVVHQSCSMFVMCFERLWWSLGTLLAPYSPYFQMYFLYAVRTRIVSLTAVQQPLYTGATWPSGQDHPLAVILLAHASASRVLESALSTCRACFCTRYRPGWPFSSSHTWPSGQASASHMSDVSIFTTFRLTTNSRGANK